MEPETSGFIALSRERLTLPLRGELPVRVGLLRLASGEDLVDVAFAPGPGDPVRDPVPSQACAGLADAAAR